MNDLEVSGSDSDPVSEVNPEEMARLMADLDEMDNDLFKSTLKSGGKSSGGKPAETTEGKNEPKDINRRVTFKKDSPSLGNTATQPPDDDDDDWDAGDLLLSDDEGGPQKQASNKTTEADASYKSPGKPAASSVNKTSIRKDKTQPSSPLSVEEGKKVSTEVTAAPLKKKSKARLMEDLFGDQDNDQQQQQQQQEHPTASGGVRGAGKAMGRPGGKTGRGKEEVTFDDDNNIDLLGDYGGGTKMASSSPKGENFLNALLKSPSSSEATTRRERRSEFVLDDKYKNVDAGNEDRNSKQRGFGSYMPSTSKPGSPRQSPKQSGFSGKNESDFSPDPKKRPPHSAPQRRKPYELNDDDIMGNIRSRRTIKKEVASPEAATHHAKTKTNNTTTPPKKRSDKKDDWLFENTDSSPSVSVKKVDVDVEGSVMPASSVGGDGSDWLGNILSTRNKSQETRNSNVGVLSSSSSNVKQPASTPDSGLMVGEFNARQNKEQLQQHQPLEASQLMDSNMQDLTAKMSTQQKQLEAQMVQQLQQQQQLMTQTMQNQMEAAEKRYRENLLTVSQLNVTPVNPPASLQLQQGQSVEIELRKAEIEVGRLKAELDLVRKQHLEEVAMMEEGCRRKLAVEKEVWASVETRLREDKDGLLTDFHHKIAALQAEKENLASSYQSQMSTVKAEWTAALERTKELYSDMVQRMKQENNCTLERLTHLKDIEVKAAITSSGHVREAETVMTQLESNTSELSTLTSLINARNESALELTQKALKMKEKQLQDFERELSASRAETEGERGRLNAVINRLENTLVQQGSEVEKERWRLAQERLKIEVERQSLTEERKHLQLSNETERHNLAASRESMMLEHRSLLQSVARHKQDLAVQEAKINVHQRLHTNANVLKDDSVGVLETVSGVGLTRDQHQQQHIQDKLSALTLQARHLNEKEATLDEASLKLEQDRAKVELEREMLRQDQAVVSKSRLEVNTRQEQMRQQQTEQQTRLTHIASQIRSLHSQQHKIDLEQQKLQQMRDEVTQLIRGGLCVGCEASGVAGRILASSSSSAFQSTSIIRLPGDGGEGRTSHSHKSDMSPSSVLARLTAARQQHNAHQEQRLLQISALKSL
ncbi:hypothetical protein Pmani_003452 [Petrolisthes manimaculis]|uniref:Fas-binding factor 1 C-terminal domain-containing protein n=1 Tax=Petrolisthes manimaculis TaxID=1843537 RepID=A0AAE1UQ10_9EUCA|nr:hypothetical protein Pmani_003452 [Petrolisthes manimaculis]